jgi:hypothetical protein
VAVTYEQAREIVRREVEPGWTQGTFCLDDRMIVENESMYAFNVGAREWIVDGNMDYLLLGALPVVYKEDGRLAWLPSVDIGTDSTLQDRPNPAPTLQV